MSLTHPQRHQLIILDGGLTGDAEDITDESFGTKLCKGTRRKDMRMHPGQQIIPNPGIYL